MQLMCLLDFWSTHSTLDPWISGKGVHMCINVWGFALLILSHFS